jgi:hypothetical protein
MLFTSGEWRRQPAPGGIRSPAPIGAIRAASGAVDGTDAVLLTDGYAASHGHATKIGMANYSVAELPFTSQKRARS